VAPLRLTARGRKLERLQRRAEVVVGLMRADDLLLRCEHRDGYAVFYLSNGVIVDKTTARLLINTHVVTPCDDALFPHVKSQSYRVATPLPSKQEI
jgi:hypothetical protein